MRLNDTVKMTLLAGIVAMPAVAQQATPDRAAPDRAVPERAAPAVPATPAPLSIPGQRMTEQRRLDPAALATGMRASKVVGATVRNSEKESIGTIDDLILTRDTRVPVAVLSVGGFLGIGAKLVAVPFERLTFDAEGNVTLPNATRESLKALPEFKYPA